MNKKNFILGLSLVLSSVATLNLSSCHNDDDDDANHAPKSVQVDQQKTDDTKKTDASTSFEENIKKYISELGPVKKIHVTVDGNYITICFNANNSDQDMICKKLDPATKKNGELTTMIKEKFPKVKHYTTVIAPYGKKDYYMINYKN